MLNSINTRQLTSALEDFEQKLECLNKKLAKELIYYANKAQGYLADKDYHAADNVLSTAQLCIKRNLGSEISLRSGFELSSIIVENVRSHIAHPAVLANDAADFSERFFQIYSNVDFRGPGLPDYLMQRPFPEGYKQAANQIIDVLESYELPDEYFKLLKKDVKNIEKQAAVFKDGNAGADGILMQKILITTLYFNMLDIQGVYMSECQLMGIMGMILFAVPAWLCAAPPAWLAQVILVVFGGIIYGIYRGMRFASTKGVYKNMWTYIEDCSKTVAQALAELNRQIAGMDPDQKKDIKDALIKTRKELLRNKITPSGNKGKVLKKLNALIGAL